MKFTINCLSKADRRYKKERDDKEEVLLCHINPLFVLTNKYLIMKTIAFFLRNKAQFPPTYC